LNLSAARVFVRNLAEAQHFYGSVLSLPQQAGGVEYGFCVFASGSAQLVVEPVEPDAPEEDQVLVGRFTGLSFSVASVQDKYDELRAKGVHFTDAPELQSWGGVLATFRDPAGNELQLVQAPSAA
jgi:catechol 2,3-dioxygenase-like lactoylglutathione lyase family enzyme